MKIEAQGTGHEPHGGISEKTKGPKGGLELLRAVIHKLPTTDLHEGHKIFAAEIARRQSDDASKKPVSKMTDKEFADHVQKVIQTPGHPDA